MAKPFFILQGIRKDNDHESAVKSLIKLKDLSRLIISVAFVRESGISRIAKLLHRKASKTTALVGIRNGSTSAQGLQALLKCKVNLFVVDTGATSPIFHPKVYLSVANDMAKLLIGSANLTYSGLNQNIEASTIINIDRANDDDEAFLQNLLEAFDSLQRSYPKHVLRISKMRDITLLLKQGRLEDESYIPRQNTTHLSGKTKRDGLKRIKLFTRHLPPIRPRKIKKPRTTRARIPGKLELLWVSKELTERDLNIPSGKTTNPTGSMLFKKGKAENIDQRSFFRKSIFSNLVWQRDARSTYLHLERARASFEIIIKGISYGTFALKLTHNTRKDTSAYKQKNAMTQIHWGKVKAIIAQRDLLGRELRLYKKQDEARTFVIEID